MDPSRKKQREGRRSSSSQDPAFTKSIKSNVGTGDIVNADPPAGGGMGSNSSSSRRHAEEAFSSSSDDGVPPRPLTRTRGRFPTSEFDKALLTGKPSIGAASFDGNEFAMTVPSAESMSTTAQDSSDGDAPTSTSAATADESSQAKKPSSRPRPNRGRYEPTRPPQPPSSNNASGPPNAAMPIIQNPSMASQISEGTTSTAGVARSSSGKGTTAARNPLQQTGSNLDEDLAQGVLPDVLMTMRQKIESLTLFDSDMMKLAEASDMDGFQRDSLKRSSQQSLSAAVLVSLAHKRYERRRLAAMEIEKVIRSLVHQGELDRVRAILLLLSDDYVRSNSEDARKGGVVALAACAIGMKKASGEDPKILECRDLILASVVHACQDHSQRVRYYATESLFNVIKVINVLAVQHFFILFEILRSLYADVDVDVRSGAELLDKKLKEVIVGAINSGSFSADACVPIFARFVYMRNKATKRLTLTWLQELNEKLLGNPVLEFLHLFLGGIFAMIADPNIQIRQSALAFLQSVLPKLLMDNEAFDDKGASMKVDFDKLIQSLVTTLEHPDPFVRKVAMYWMCRIVKAYMGGEDEVLEDDNSRKLSPASMSVRNSLPHVLPGILLSIGDTFHSKASTKDSFLPDQTTHSLAEQTNACLQAAVRQDGKAYATHLDGFLVALREELDSPGKDAGAALERKQYRMDVTPDGTGIESTGWYRASQDTPKTYEEDATAKSRLCALEWITVLYASVVPDELKAEFAREFISPIIHQLVGNPPERIIFKSLEVLANITVPVDGEKKQIRSMSNASLTGLGSYHGAITDVDEDPQQQFEPPMTNADAIYALEILDFKRGQSKSRDRGVFSAVIQLHAYNHQLLADLSRVIQFMCTLQPPEFVFISFAVELDRFVRLSLARNGVASPEEEKKDDGMNNRKDSNDHALSKDLLFVSSFVQQMTHVLLATDEASDLRELLRDCVGRRSDSERDKRRIKLFHILLHSFSHNLIASVSLCLWGGAYRTAAYFLQHIDPLDIHLVFLLELDKMVELLERPLFRHFHLRMLEADADPSVEGSGAMLFRALKLLLMIVPQSSCYRILRDRLVTASRFRQSALVRSPFVPPAPKPSLEEGQEEGEEKPEEEKEDKWLFGARVLEVRKLHCDVCWETIRSESLETPSIANVQHDDGSQKRKWLGFASKEEELASQKKFAEEKRQLSSGFKIEEITDKKYHQIEDMATHEVQKYQVAPPNNEGGEEGEWKDYWKQKTDAEDSK